MSLQHAVREARSDRAASGGPPGRPVERPAALRALQQAAGNRAVSAALRSTRGTAVHRCGPVPHEVCPCNPGAAGRSVSGAQPLGAGTAVDRQAVSGPGVPGGPDRCDDLLQAIIDLLDEVAKRFNDALDDQHGLYRRHRRVQDAHPDHGSWDGHRDRYDYDRGRLRHKLAEWDLDDECRGRPLAPRHQEDLREAREFGEKEFPDRPARELSRSSEPEGDPVWDQLRRHLPEYLVAALIAAGAVATAVALVACFGSGACEVALAVAGLGVVLAGAVAAALRAAGIRDEPAGGPVAWAEEPADEYAAA